MSFHDNYKPINNRYTILYYMFRLEDHGLDIKYFEK